MNTLATGQRGEQIAAEYLRSIGYKLHDRNVRFGRCEIDIVAYDTELRMLVFCEVKTRSKYDRDFDPTLSLTYRKKKALRRAAWRWIKDRDYDSPWRIDAVIVVGNRVRRHIRQLR